VRFEFEFGIVSFRFVFLLSLLDSENRVCLAAAARRAATRIVAGVGDLVLGGRAIERSGGTVYGLHRARGDDEHMFLG
jgi:hypothetical protein